MARNINNCLVTYLQLFTTYLHVCSGSVVVTAYGTETKSIQLHDSIVMALP